MIHDRNGFGNGLLGHRGPSLVLSIPLGNIRTTLCLGSRGEGQTPREFYLLTLVSDLSHASPSCIEVSTESGLEVALK